MPGIAVIDLTIEDDDEAVGLIRRHDDSPIGRPAQRNARRAIPRPPPRPLVNSDAAGRQRQATIDLTVDETSAANVPGRTGSANEAGSILTNDWRPDSRSQNQNTSARTPRTTAGASSKPRAQISGDTSIAPGLARTSANTAPAALNPEYSPMFPGGIAHRPGNPYGRRVWGIAALNHHPQPPSEDGSTPTRPQIISSSDEDDGSTTDDDDDLQIVEEKSTPASTSRQANRPESRQEHVSTQSSVEVSVSLRTRVGYF